MDGGKSGHIIWIFELNEDNFEKFIFFPPNTSIMGAAAEEQIMFFSFVQMAIVLPLFLTYDFKFLM